VAVALTGIVHLLNNLFKLTLLGKNASRALVLKFGIPSIVGGFIGAYVLSQLSDLAPLTSWTFRGTTLFISPLKVVIAILMIFFALMEILPKLKSLEFAQRYLTIGGLTSGFFGGLSGHQGALRSAFLINCGLKKEQFIATGVVIACLVDFTRLPVYYTRFNAQQLTDQWPLLVVATASAFAGAWIGNRFIKKVTLQMVQQFTAFMIILIGVLLGVGIL
jgi:hypothetical protein